jgi:uncharacterized OB-fold protein
VDDRCPQCGKTLPEGIACPGCGQVVSSVTIYTPPDDDDDACAHLSKQVDFQRLPDGRFLGTADNGESVLHECPYH